MFMGCSAGTWILQMDKITKQKQHHYGYRERWGRVWWDENKEAESQRSPKLKMKPKTWYCKTQKNIQTRKLLVETSMHLYFSTVVKILMYFKMIKGREITGVEAEGCPLPCNQELLRQQQQHLGSKMLPTAWPSCAQTQQTELSEKQAAKIAFPLP